MERRKTGGNRWTSLLTVERVSNPFACLAYADCPTLALDRGRAQQRVRRLTCFVLMLNLRIPLRKAIEAWVCAFCSVLLREQVTSTGSIQG